MRRTALLLLVPLTACAPRHATERRFPTGDRAATMLVSGGGAANAETMLAIGPVPGDGDADDDPLLMKLAGRHLRVARISPGAAPADDAHWVAIVEAARAALGQDKVHILGEAWGSSVALAYATAHPEHVRSLVLAAPAKPAAPAATDATSTVASAQPLSDKSSLSSIESPVLILYPAGRDTGSQEIAMGLTKAPTQAKAVDGCARSMSECPEVWLRDVQTFVRTQSALR
jgi:dienelactone hydrolase